MADETQISTPVDTSVADTSANVEPETSVTTEETTDTSTAEPATVETTAETETTQADTLYAGKYKTVDELVKGYEEAQKFVNKASEWETKYNDLVAKQAQELEKAQAQRLQDAKTRGFNSYEEQQIAEQLQIAEFEQFANNLNEVPAEHLETVRQYLLQYYNTAHPDYLAEAKRYFPANFIEKAALDKSRLENQLMSDFKNKQAQADEQRTAKLAGDLTEKVQNLLGSNAAELRVSFENLLKNQAKHPEIGFEMYANMTNYIANPLYQFPRNNKLITFIKQNDKIYELVIKTTQDKSINFFNSFRVSNFDDVQDYINKKR